MIKPASGLCNLQCDYCFYTDETRHRRVPFYGIMQSETLEAIVKKAFQTATRACCFAFQGGEPTLAGLDFYRRLVQLQQRYNVRGVQIQNAIQTNGYVLDESWAQFFAEHRFLVGISLDGTREIHDSFRKSPDGGGTYCTVKKAVSLLEQYAVEYNILCVVTGPAARHPQKVYQALKDYRYLQFIPCLDGIDGERRPYTLTPERYGGFLKTVFDLYYQDLTHGVSISVRDFDNYIRMLSGQAPELCGMNGTCTCQLVIESDGSVYPCDFYVLDEYRLGSVFDSSFEELLCCGAAREFVETSYAIPASCRACEWFALCRGGCRRNREAGSSGTLGRNRFCNAYREFFRHAYPRMAQLGQNLYLMRTYGGAR